MTRTPSQEIAVDPRPQGDDEDDAFVPVPLVGELGPGSVVGDYTIECKLGDGGMATVYGATHPLIGKKAAIKVMNTALSRDAGLVERFILEAQAVNHIGHPNIVDVFSFGQLPDGRHYFVMEWLPGDTLYARMWDRRLTLDESLDVLDQMCDALEAAHEAGIVHRDLKPANVLLTPRRGRREQVKLLDFGVAKLTRDDAPGAAVGLAGPQTQHGQVVGTPEYIAPEQARGKNVDGKCDVYAMGVIAFEMILGRRPFVADNNADLVRMHLAEKPPAPRSIWPEIPSLLEDLMLAMLEKKGADRPSPREIRGMIRELRGTPVPFDDDGSSAPTPSLVLEIQALRPRRRRPLARVAIGLALLGFGAAMLVALVWRWRVAAAHDQVAAAALATPAPANSSAKGAAVPANATAATANATAATANATATTAKATATTANATAATAKATATAANAAGDDAAPDGTARGSTADEVAGAPTDGDGMVQVRVDAPDARIELDGKLVAQAAAGARVAATVGAHRLSVTAPGRLPFAGRVVVAGGRVSELRVHLRGRPSARANVRPPANSPTAAPAPASPKRDPDYLVDPFAGNK